MNDSKEWLYIGDDEKYRYALGEPGTYNLVIIGLNPSTATPDKLDPTIRRIRKTVEKSQYDGWIMINLCAIRIPNPDELPNELDNKVSQKNIEVVDIIQDVSWYTEVQQSMGILSIHCMFRTNKN